jgi:hypothetical protein
MPSASPHRRPHDANYRDGDQRFSAGSSSGRGITLEAHIAEYSPAAHAALRKTLSVGDAGVGSDDRPDLGHRDHRETYPSAKSRAKTWEIVERFT